MTILAIVVAVIAMILALAVVFGHGEITSLQAQVLDLRCDLAATRADLATRAKSRGKRGAKS